MNILKVGEYVTCCRGQGRITEMHNDPQGYICSMVVELVDPKLPPDKRWVALDMSIDHVQPITVH